ncbi:MAG: hypothetical protein WD342_14610 [Verrucomicrobiales bacterium]
MNRTETIATALAVLLLTISPGLKAQDETPNIPVGSLSAYPTLVQTGTHPTLTWDVTIPETVSDVIEIQDPGTLVPQRDLVMDVRVLGASVKRVWTNGQGNVVKWEWVPTEARIKYNGNGYNRIFYDTQDDVHPNQIVHSQTVEKSSTVDFGARYVNSNGSWATWYSSTNSSGNVVALVNGDTPPTTTPMYEQPDIESFILPYLDDEGKISLGARDVIYLMELTHTDPSHSGFDLQDMALLVTFYDEVVGDNGNGNDDDNSSDSGDSPGNPGNDKAVGNAGENPDGGDDWGSGSRGKGDVRGRRKK